ncbi:MAG TPA: leucine/isoleucine/valine transporter permease subunit, partial [Candidatus Limnocylindria bacterium]|nr:leucine/isoleucine/valine transporter permease subunit [Candidatus Limnocylindria bacterium]
MDRSLVAQYRRAILLGLIGGVIVIYLALVGIVERFEARPIITDYLTFGILAPALGLLIPSYRATRPRSPDVALPALHAAGSGIAAGFAGGVLAGGFVFLNSTVDLSGMFVNATANLSEVLGLGFEPAAIGPVVLGLLMGVFAAVLCLIPSRVRGPVLWALTAVLLASLMEPFMRVLLLQLNLDAVARFLYRSGGLTLQAAIVIFVAAAAIGLVGTFRGATVRRRVDSLTIGRERDLQIVAFVALGLFLLVLPQIIGSFLSEVIGTVGLYVLMGLGLNIVVGYAGLLDLGYVAFFAIGAYTTAILTSPASVLGIELSFWIALPIVMVIAAGAGLLIGAPVLRLRGDYLAIVTLGIGEIVRILLLSDALRPWTGGAQGILQIPPPALGDLNFFDPQVLYYPILVAVAA